MLNRHIHNQAYLMGRLAYIHGADLHFGNPFPCLGLSSSYTEWEIGWVHALVLCDEDSTPMEDGYDAYGEKWEISDCPYIDREREAQWLYGYKIAEIDSYDEP
jgi:hypothetical protein